VESYDDSSLKRKINNNRSLISQVAGLTSDDDLSDNSLGDLKDVDVATASAGQVLTWVRF